MINKAQVLTLSLLCLFITACKPQNKEKTKRTQYIELKSLDTWAHPDDYKIHMKMANYCRKFLKEKDTLDYYHRRFWCGYENYRITTVYMGMTPIDDVPKFLAIIKKIKTLKTLSIYGTGIRNLSAALAEMPPLKNLYLKRVDIGIGKTIFTLPPALHQLESLSLRRMNISQIDVPKNCKVKQLKIKNLPLKAPQASIRKFRHLEKLILDAKLLIQLKDHLQKFENLREIEICDLLLDRKTQKELIKKYPTIRFKFCQIMTEVDFKPETSP